MGYNSCYDIDFSSDGAFLIGGCINGANKRGIKINVATQGITTLLTAGQTLRTAAHSLDGTTHIFGGD